MSSQERFPGLALEEIAKRRLELSWSDGASSSLHALWLRDHCPSGGDKMSQLRTFSVADLDPELTIAEALLDESGDLVVVFSDGHRSHFESEWLRAHGVARAGSRESTDTWRRGFALDEFAFDRLTPESRGHHDLLTEIVRSGAAVVTGVPSAPSGTEALAAITRRSLVAVKMRWAEESPGRWLSRQKETPRLVS